MIESLLLFAQFLRVSTPHIAKTDYRITPKGKYEFGGEEIELEDDYFSQIQFQQSSNLPLI